MEHLKATTNGKLQVLPGASHAPYRTNAAESNDLLVEFVREQ